MVFSAGYYHDDPPNPLPETYINGISLISGLTMKEVK